jgi:hypothetical protein
MKDRQYIGEKKKDKQRSTKHYKEDTNGRKSMKDRQYNGEKKKDKQRSTKHYIEDTNGRSVLHRLTTIGIFYVMSCRSLFVLFLFAIVLSVLHRLGQTIQWRKGKGQTTIY